MDNRFICVNIYVKKVLVLFFTFFASLRWGCKSRLEKLRLNKKEIKQLEKVRGWSPWPTTEGTLV